MASTWQGFTEEDQAKIKFGYGDARISMYHATFNHFCLTLAQDKPFFLFTEIFEANSGHGQPKETYNSSDQSKKKVEKKSNKKSSSLPREELPTINDLPSEAMFTHKQKVMNFSLLQ